MKVLALLLVGLVLVLQYRLWIADGGMREVWHLRQEVAAQTAENTKLKDRNRTLAAEVMDLKKGKSAIEERARTDLGMVGANETFFQVADAPIAAEPKQEVVAPTLDNHDKNTLQVNDATRTTSGNRGQSFAVQAAK